MEMFSMTEEAIRHRYFTEYATCIGGFGDAIDNGLENIDDDYDPNEMVIDSVTHRPMTRRELKSREFIRFMSDCGWSDIRLMRYFGVGSGYEINLMEKKRAVRSKAKKKAKNLAVDVIGDNLDYASINSIDELNDMFFDD